MSSAKAFSAPICSSLIGSPSSFSASASAIQSRRHVRNLKSEEKRYDISFEAYRSVRGFDATSRFTEELYFPHARSGLRTRSTPRHAGDAQGRRPAGGRADAAGGLHLLLQRPPHVGAAAVAAARQRAARRHRPPAARERAPARGNRERAQVDLRRRAHRPRGPRDVEEGRGGLHAAARGQIVRFVPMDNKELIRRAYDELSNGNSRPLLELLADDVAWTVMGRTK